MSATPTSKPSAPPPTPLVDSSGTSGDTPRPPRSPGDTPASFEQAIKRLSEIVTTLEDGDLSLEDSLRLFEEGVTLSRVSQERLDNAQKKVEQLLGVDAEGRPRTAPFSTTGNDGDDEREPPRSF
jgi:exodeoxyribonuclease VII small subunit